MSKMVFLFSASCSLHSVSIRLWSDSFSSSVTTLRSNVSQYSSSALESLPISTLLLKMSSSKKFSLLNRSLEKLKTELAQSGAFCIQMASSNSQLLVPKLLSLCLDHKCSPSFEEGVCSLLSSLLHKL